MYQSTCPGCKDMHKNRNPSLNPPCNTCRIDLIDSNQNAGKVFMMCRGQIITAGMGDIIDINLLAVKAVMDIEGIKNQRDCLKKVHMLFSYWNKSRKKQE